MTFETRRVKIALIDEMLGTNPGDKDVHSKFIASKAPDAETREEELQHMEAAELEKKEMTVFYRNADGEIEMPCYHVYGFFKSACGFLRRCDGTESKKLTAYKKVIDGLIKVFPDVNDKTGRYITLHLPDGSSEVGNCQRPLRAQTMQGDRVALANSETVPIGTTFEFDIICLDKKVWKNIEEWLDYGVFSGFGQWRNSGKGAFTWEYVE